MNLSRLLDIILLQLGMIKVTNFHWSSIKKTCDSQKSLKMVYSSNKANINRSNHWPWFSRAPTKQTWATQTAVLTQHTQPENDPILEHLLPMLEHATRHLDQSRCNSLQIHRPTTPRPPIRHWQAAPLTSHGIFTTHHLGLLMLWVKAGRFCSLLPFQQKDQLQQSRPRARKFKPCASWQQRLTGKRLVEDHLIVQIKRSNLDFWVPGRQAFQPVVQEFRLSTLRF